MNYLKLLDFGNPNDIIFEFEFYNEQNEKLDCVHAQKDLVFFRKDNLLYKTSIPELLNPLV